MALGGAARGDVVETKGPAEGRVASDMAMRSASFCSAAWACALQFLTDSLRAVSNPTDSRTMFFRHKEKNEDKKKVIKRTKQTFGPGALL